MSEAKCDRPEMTSEHNPELAAQLRKYQEDYFWCMKQTDLLLRYKDQILILHDRKILGSGPTGPEAWEDARRRATERGEPLPARKELMVFFVPEQIFEERPFTSADLFGDSPVQPASSPGDA